MKWTNNFLLLTNYSINRSEVEVIKSTGNSSNHRIYNNNNNEDSQSHSTTTISIPSEQQEEELLLSPFTKCILIVDDDTDITLTFKKGLEAENNNTNNKTSFKVYTHNDL